MLSVPAISSRIATKKTRPKPLIAVPFRPVNDSRGRRHFQRLAAESSVWAAINQSKESSTMSAYLVSQVEVLDPEAWESYRIRAAPAIAQFGGRYLVRGAVADVIEADWPAEEPPPQTVIVAEFPSMKALQAWYDSPEYAEAYAFRGAAVKRR